MSGITQIHPAACACCGDMLRARFDRRAFLQGAGALALAGTIPGFVFAAEGHLEQ